jgi:transcriptional regulator with XRE-family HTH domain
MAIVAKRKPKRETNFGTRLRNLREAAGLSQVQLGERAGGIAYQTIAKYERGEMVPNWPTVLDLAEALGVSTEEFRTGDAAPTVPTPQSVVRPMGKRK